MKLITILTLTVTQKVIYPSLTFQSVFYKTRWGNFSCLLKNSDVITSSLTANRDLLPLGTRKTVPTNAASPLCLQSYFHPSNAVFSFKTHIEHTDSSTLNDLKPSVFPFIYLVFLQDCIFSFLMTSNHCIIVNFCVRHTHIHHI